MKRYRITNKFRFTCFVIITTLLIMMTFVSLFGLSTASGSIEHKYETIHIYSGDTMWAIAEKYKPEQMDIRDYVYEICKANNIDAGYLSEGQELKVPIM